ncbi:hypothetical protein EW026_g4222 [Hermanssonia centrifuga]|uniref:Uncharacterized protein n=1 Tax=Hermanssonia centrifuga TaxID=98765 RepID=A0A4S4KHU8_9APHY|nr:hypothetical protein EW026_g4222 [Hermanssonia centrifuga]
MHIGAYWAVLREARSESPINAGAGKPDVKQDCPTYPWSSMAMFLTDALFSSPRLHFSEVQKTAVLDWAKHMGASDVPSLYSIKKCQERICAIVGNPTEKVVSKSGTVFYLNDIASAISKDYANPITRSSMQDYPIDCNGSMSQVHHASKMLLDLPDECGPPSANTEEFGHGFAACSSVWKEKMPHAFRSKANGRMVYAVPIMIFMDDVSGNISKQWNKHHVIYMSNANMPREMIEKEFCVRFVSSSPNATPLELMDAMRESIRKASENGIVAWDCMNKEEVILCPYPLLFAGDNPMQAEECSQGGLACNYFCRTCKVGGTKEKKMTDDGFESLFHCGELRKPEETRAEVITQLGLGVLPGAQSKVKKRVEATGVSDATTREILKFLATSGQKLRGLDGDKKRMMSENEVAQRLEKDLQDWLGGEAKENRINPLLGMQGVDIHQDTPTEILHTVLLGVVKYFWAQSMVLIEKNKQIPLFQARLASLNTEGLKDPDLRAEYLVQYKGSLIGKHFKSLAQNIIAVVNVQHDCITAGCWDTETVPIRQERQETTRMKQIVQHVVGDEDIYLLNSHALHNYQHLANVIPTHLKLQICVVADGKSARARAAKGLRENAASKKAAATAEKGKATSASAEDGEAQTYQESLEDTEIVVDSATPQVAHADLEDGENPGDMEICGQRNIVHGAADGHAAPSDFDNEVTDVRVIKRRKAQASDIAHNAGLQEDALEDFASRGYTGMLMTIMANLLVMQTEKIECELQQALVKSVFLEQLMLRLLTTLVSPNLTAYLTNLVDEIMHVIETDPHIYDVDPNYHEHPKAWQDLTDKIGSITIKQRARIRTNLLTGITNKLPIDQVLQLVIKQHTAIYPSMAHFCRFAFLRKSLILFNTLEKRTGLTVACNELARGGRLGSKSASPVAEPEPEHEPEHEEEVPPPSIEPPPYVTAWLAKNRDDPSLVDFLPSLKDHLLARLAGRVFDGDEHEFTDIERGSLRLKDNRLYLHKVMRINYTTYDMRRDQDSINPRTHADIMVLSPEEDQTHPYWFGRVLGIYHAFVMYTGPGSKSTSLEYKRTDFLWVQWFGPCPGESVGFRKRRLPQIGFIPYEKHDAGPFGFLDPALVVHAVHLIPAFHHGKTDTLLPDSIVRQPSEGNEDWAYYYVNIDMFMRFLGGGIGHKATRLIVKISETLKMFFVYEDQASREAAGSHSVEDFEPEAQVDEDEEDKAAEDDEQAELPEEEEDEEDKAEAEAEEDIQLEEDDYGYAFDEVELEEEEEEEEKDLGPEDGEDGMLIEDDVGYDAF